MCVCVWEYGVAGCVHVARCSFLMWLNIDIDDHGYGAMHNSGLKQIFYCPFARPLYRQFNKPGEHLYIRSMRSTSRWIFFLQ